MLKKITHIVTRKPRLIVVLALILLIPSLVGTFATSINYDMLTYLPAELESIQGEALLEDPFHYAATTMLIVENMPPLYTDQLRNDILDIPGVSNATWLSSVMGIQIPANMLPQEVRESFYAGDSTMMIIQYDKPGSSLETMEAISEVRNLCNKNCFLSGFSAIIKDTKDLTDQDLPIYVGLAVSLALVVMLLTTDSWFLPFALLLDIGLAILYNMGSNIFLGEISYITKAIAAVLQLAVTMDYSIFLYHRYNEERANFSDHRDAMAKAVEAAMVSLTGSSTTTIAGFMALCFMRLTLGKDIGIVMIKGVVLGVLSVLLILPSILLVMDEPIQKAKHKSLLPSFSKLNSWVLQRRKRFVAIFLLLFIPFIYGQNHVSVYYDLFRALPEDMPSIIANNKLEEEYNMATTHFALLDRNVSPQAITELTSKIKELAGIESVLAYDSIIDPTLPEFFVPDEIKNIFKSEDYQIIMITSSFETATDPLNEQITQLQNLLKTYDPNSLLTGEGVMTKDLIDIASVDFKTTNIISVVSILLIIGFIFKSLSIPLVLVSLIELAIFINQGIPYFTGSIIPFISPTIIGCIQMGATVDYAILITTRFREELRKGLPTAEAAHIAATTSDASIITSSMVMFFATFGVAMYSNTDIIASICLMLARGSLISALLCIFVLPSLLQVCEPFINRTSRNWKSENLPGLVPKAISHEI